MFELMLASFEGLDRSTFLRDLEEKDWVILLTNGSGRIVGFSTQMLSTAEVEGRLVRAIFSGDTIVDPEYWGQTELVRLWGRFVLQMLDRYGDEPLYWFLICMGYKTYRFLPVFFHEFFPHYNVETPLHEQTILNSLATTRFPETFDPQAGVVRPMENRVRLRPGVADIDPWREKNPHIRFFAHRNPGHIDGDELVCIAPLSRENLKPRAHAIIQRHGTTVMEL
jgi:hypothetical protein